LVDWMLFYFMLCCLVVGVVRLLCGGGGGGGGGGEGVTYIFPFELVELVVEMKNCVHC